METYVKIKGFDIYSVSNMGNVRNDVTGIIKKLTNGAHGYKIVHLSNGSRLSSINKYVHRLVAEAFLSNPDGLPCVNHKDEDKANNCVDNLEWCSYEYNTNYGTRNSRAGKKLSEQRKGSRNPMYGKHLSDEAKLKISMSNRKKDA